MSDKQHNPETHRIRKKWRERHFEPHPLLPNQHLMTILPGFLPRRFTEFQSAGSRRLFQLNPDNKMLGYCHWQPDGKKDDTAVILLHGLEGSSESGHVLGMGYKAFSSGFNVVRLNMRNCGGSMSESVSLYNAGMWEDLHHVMQNLQESEGFKSFYLAGYSLGGNLMLNTAAHHDPSHGYRIKAVCAVSPAIDLASAVDAIELPHNRIYQDWFLRSMKAMMLEKAKQHPSIYENGIDILKKITTIREFDDRFTAPHGGYGNAERYYKEASSLFRLSKIKVPVFMLSAEDDPLVPIKTFHELAQTHPEIELVITTHGGHGGFLQRKRKEAESFFDHYWAENRVVDFIREVNRT